MNEKFVVKGGKKIDGEIGIRGAKNSIGNLMMAALLTDEPCVLANVPDNKETEIVIELCEHIGSTVEKIGNEIRIHTPEIKNFRIKELSRKNRIPILAMGPLLARTGRAELPLLGGDKIGPRPVNFHIDALRSLGAEIEETDKAYKASARDRLKGTKINFFYPSVGATQNILISSVLARGETIIINAAVEPEVADLIQMLCEMGADIKFDEAERIVLVKGVGRLRGVSRALIPDRLEVASFAVLALATGGNLFVKNAREDHLVAFLGAVKKIGGEYAVEEKGIRFIGDQGRGKFLGPIHIETDTYPGFATDWQQPFAVLMTKARGRSIIHETVYEDRFNYTGVLNAMGADTKVINECMGEIPCRFRGKMYNHTCVINGNTPLKAAQIHIPDIRAGMAQLIAALMADGVSEIYGVEHLDRGYENIDCRLRSIGADIKRINI